MTVEVSQVKKGQIVEAFFFLWQADFTFDCLGGRKAMKGSSVEIRPYESGGLDEDHLEVCCYRLRD